MSSEPITNGNYRQTNENNGFGHRVQNKTAVHNERRVLAPISLKASNNVLTERTNQLKGKSSNGLQQTVYNNNKANAKSKTWQKSANLKTSEDAIKSSKSGSDFSIFCDQSDSETNETNSYDNNNENAFESTLDEIKEEMDSSDETDHLLSERTENYLAIEEEISEELSERDMKCNESIDIESEDEELEDTSVSEQTLLSFDSRALTGCKEYANEIHRYLMFYERERMADPFYIAKQPEINAKMRSILIDWLVEVTEEYKLLDQTLFLAVNYIDRFLSLMSVSRQSFQLLGTSSLFIASKYEEIYPPELSEFVYITDDSYTKKQILNMEKLILKGLQFDVSAPTTYYFCQKFSSDLQLEPIVKHLAKYLCHLTLLESEPFLRYYPSEVAICSVILSAQTLGFHSLITNEFIEQTLEYERELKSENINPFLADRQSCMQALHRMHAFAHKHPQQAIQTKFASDKYYRVSIVEPMTTCLPIH